MNLKDIAKRVIKLMPELPKEAGALVDSVTEPGQLADLITSNLDIQVDEKQDVLETFDLKARIRKVLQFLSRQLEVLKVRERINTQVQEEMGRNQREYVLRQQLKAIKEELGELDEGGGDLDEFEEKIAGGEDACRDARRSRTSSSSASRCMQPSSAEYTVTRTYLEWLVELPWAIETEDKLDIQEARDILDDDHYGLEKVKKRILEYLAVRKLKNDKKGPILCLVGPPGVGKTSLGRSIAKAIGRKFVRISLGGVRDEAEIRGHRRTYVGSLPGRIIQGMKKAGTNNPVFMLDEIDKLGHDFRGDPASALLEVLDPEQNNTFTDHYLEVPFDLSQVMFIATANVLDPIPAALAIASRSSSSRATRATRSATSRASSSCPSSSRSTASKPSRSRSPTSAVAEVIDSYTREAGVRNLEREIGSIVPRRRGQGRRGRDARSSIVKDTDVPEYLGPQKFMSRSRRAHRRAGRGDGPGVDAGRRRHPLHRGDADAGQGQARPHRAARRRDEGVGAGGAVVRARQGRVARHRARTSSRRPTSTSTSRRAPCRRTDRRRASPCSPRSSRCSPACRSATTWR